MNMNFFSGILPIDQMRDYVGPINTVASLIPRKEFTRCYGIIIPQPLEGENPDRPPSCEELLCSYGFTRGFMTQRGIPDNARSARYILKDYMNGTLRYCHAPPGSDQDTYHTFDQERKRNLVSSTPRMMAAIVSVKL